MSAMTATQNRFPDPVSGSQPTLAGRAMSAYRESVQTRQEGTTKAHTFYVVTDNGTPGDIQITTTLIGIISCVVKRVSDGVYLAAPCIPLSSDARIAVVSGLAASTACIITIYGR